MVVEASHLLGSGGVVSSIGGDWSILDEASLLSGGGIAWLGDCVETAHWLASAVES